MSSASEVDARSVFVVHGRNLSARNAVYDFLRGIDLRPLEWDVVAGQTGSGAPYVFEIIERGFELAQAIVVILTPDEEVTLRATLRSEPNDTKSRTQPRPNVLFEAGMAFMRDRRRTILLQIGGTDVLSDLHGVHALRAGPGAGAELRKQLADRLLTAGCPVSTEGTDWLSTGNFEAAFLEEVPGRSTPPASGSTNPLHPVDPTAAGVDARGRGEMSMSKNNRSIRARDITGSSVVAGDNNRVETRMRQVPLPPATEVDVGTELAALQQLLAKLKVPERGKLERALQDATEEASKPDPDREEIGGALGRVAKYAKVADDFGEHAEKLAPRVAALGFWLGTAGRALLTTFGIGV